MKFSVVALLAAASSVVAQTPGFDVLTAPAQGEVLDAGSSFKIVWEPNGVTGTVTLHLIQGTASNTLNMGPVVGAGINNLDGAFTWSPVPDAQFAAYGLNITLDSDPSTYQLSNGFHITGTTKTSKTSTSSKARTTTVSLAPGPSYSALTYTTTTPSVPTYNATSTSSNTTWANPTSSKYTAVPTSSVVPTGSGPVVTPTQSGTPINGAASLSISGFAMIGGLLLAFAL